MAVTYYALLTTIGAGKLANATALGTTLKITQLAVGDGGGNVPTPDASRTALVNEVRRAPLNQLSIDPANSAQIIAEQVIPEDVGGWWIREMGLYDEAGALIAYANCAPSYKPQLAEGSGRTQTVRMVLIVSNTASVELKIDPSVVLATREYVDSRTVRASQQDAEEGVDNNKLMTPLRVFQAVAQKMVQATESVAGVMKIATQTQVSAGVDDSSVVTPKKLRAGFKASINANGYMAFPTWMGGLIIQWGTSQSDANGNGSLTFPMAYPSEFYGIWYGDASGSISGVNAIGTLAYSKTGVTFGVRQVASTAGTLSAFFWLSIGK